jgi:hypothetical protein
MALIDSRPADVLAVAIRVTPRFPREIRRSWFPASASGAPKHSATNHKQLAVVSVAAQKLAGFSPSQTPANYSAGYKARCSPSAYYPEHLPDALITVANRATPRFSREIRGSNFLARASRAQKHSVTTYKLSAVGAVACLKTL